MSIPHNHECYIIKTGQQYPSDYIICWQSRIASPAMIPNPYALSKYDFLILEIAYNVYTKEINGEQRVTSIWDRTSNKSVEKLEVLVRK